MDRFVEKVLEVVAGRPDPVTAKQIGELTGFSYSKVTRSLRVLQELGKVVSEPGASNGRRGRPAPLFRHSAADEIPF